jgi:hypothetical protein
VEVPHHEVADQQCIYVVAADDEAQAVGVLYRGVLEE